MKNIVVVSTQNQISFLGDLGGKAEVMNAEAYLKNEREISEQVRVFNLCNDYSYCKRGYYVSLLAEARGHRPLPSVSTISDLQSRNSVKIVSDVMSENLNQALKDIKAENFEISVYFGKNMAQRYSSLSRQIFNYFQAPMIRVFCQRKEDEWSIRSIRPIAFNEVPSLHHDFLLQAMLEFFGLNGATRKPKLHSEKYDLAILCNPTEEFPPSDEKAIKAFIKAAKDLRIEAEIIGPKDIGLLSRFDALFIRETTSVLHHTYKFAKKAEMEGLVVIDDPQSILRCCNKIYLHDMLTKKSLSTPETWIIYKDTDLSTFTQFPLIIKKPDSAFSAGVKKVNSSEELEFQANEYFKKSDLLVLQEFLQTDFDWRIGIINNEPLYACRYHMVKNHWQVINHDGGKPKEGEVDALAIEEVPRKALELALKACKQIGNGLYGVDIKEKGGRFFIIEVNDNPSIEKGCEDKVIGQQLYFRIMSTFLRRLESR
jgi:glutathione synthase/RimK-type ligase-like ATP-grasp enzyme